MLEVKIPVLYFFLLVLGVFFNLSLNVIYKYSRFAKNFSNKGLKFVLYERNSLVFFNSNLIMLLTKFNIFSKNKTIKDIHL